MKRWWKIFQVAFTYIGTIVGAGFATGQEILQFFTRFGWLATLTIAISCYLFVWIGSKLMLMANEIRAKSYEDLNKHLFGNRMGKWISLFTLIILFGITTVMLAGAGSVFWEHLHLPYQFGLIFTLLISYLIISKGIDAILAVNSFVVPIMFLFTLLVIKVTLNSPDAYNFVQLPSSAGTGRILLSPLLYTAFNLALAQAVLVPIGASIQDRDLLRKGGLLGGIGIGLMLMAGHFALSAEMPHITRYEIPMASIVHHLGVVVQIMYVLVIYAEIFTTFIANIYGLTLQVKDRMAFSERNIIITLLILCYLISQIGFKTLLSTLYPLFGWISLIWFVMIIWKRHADGTRQL